MNIIWHIGNVILKHKMRKNHKLIEVGFGVLDYMYGTLTITKCRMPFFDVDFSDSTTDVRFSYTYPKKNKRSFLNYRIKDIDFFRSILSMERTDFEWILRLWFEDRYKLRVDAIGNCGFLTQSWIKKRHQLKGQIFEYEEKREQ